MAKTFIVEVTVHDGVYESVFGNAIVKGLQFADLHCLSYLNHNIQDVTVRPYVEPMREWAVVLDSGDGTTFEWGCYSTESGALDAARIEHPGKAIVGSFPKPE